MNKPVQLLPIMASGEESSEDRTPKEVMGPPPLPPKKRRSRGLWNDSWSKTAYPEQDIGKNILENEQLEKTAAEVLMQINDEANEQQEQEQRRGPMPLGGKKFSAKSKMKSSREGNLS